jgi:hypothetical protein
VWREVELKEGKERGFGHDMTYLNVWRFGRNGKFIVDIWAWRDCSGFELEE